MEMINTMKMYIQVKVHIKAKHGEIIHFSRFEPSTNVDTILDTVLGEKKDITKIQMDRYNNV